MGIIFLASDLIVRWRERDEKHTDLCFVLFMLLLSATFMGTSAVASPISGQSINQSINQSTNQSTIVEAIKIAGGFDLTGGESSLDGPAANGAKLAVKEINESGGVHRATTGSDHTRRRL